MNTENLITEPPKRRRSKKEKQFWNCSQCGKEFEQELNKITNAYTKYERCPDCRNIISNYNSVQKQNIILKDKLHPWQKEAFNDIISGKYQCAVIIAGVRAGKDYLTHRAGIYLFNEMLNENRKIYKPELYPSVLWWVVVPTERIGTTVWGELRNILPPEWNPKYNADTKTINTIGGGVIELKTAYDPSSLVGAGVDLITFTEAGRTSKLKEVWENLEGRLISPGRGLAREKLNENLGRGRAIINSSTEDAPDYLEKMFHWGQKGHPNYRYRWISYQMPCTANPEVAELFEEKRQSAFGEITYAEELRRVIGDREFDTRYMAKFQLDYDSVFSDFELNCVTDLTTGKYAVLTPQDRRRTVIENETPKLRNTYRISWDIAVGGNTGDGSNVAVRDNSTTPFNIVRLLQLKNMSYDQQYDTIAKLSAEYNNAPCVFSSTGHTSVVGQLSKRGVREIVVAEQSHRKTDMIHALERAVQNSAFRIINDGSPEVMTLIEEVKDYTYVNGRYGNKSMPHDDWVSALYLMFHDYNKTANNKNMFFGKVKTV